MSKKSNSRPALFAGTLLIGSLLAAPLAAQPENGMRGGQPNQGNAAGRGPETAQQYRQEADTRRQEAERSREERQESAQQRQQEAEAHREQAQDRTDGPNRGAENAPPQRKAEPAAKGSEKGQAMKQEKSRAWWKFWGD